MTLDEFKAAIAPSSEARTLLAEQEDKTAAAAVKRDNADAQSLAIIERVVAAVVADA